jgi:peroxiredoxin
MNQASLTTLRDVFLSCRNLDASLAERLEMYSRAVRELLPSYADAVERLISHLTKIGAGANAPRAGEPMPAFVLPDQEGRLISLANILERGPAAITFHRGHWCPWCRISMSTLAKVQDEMTEAGGQIEAIMPEQQRFAAEFKREAASPFKVLTDLDNGYALLLNLAIWVGPDLERLLTSHGRRLPDYQGNDSWTLPIPATFVLGQDGVVRARFVDPDFRRRMTVDDLVGALRAAARGRPAGG